jgi:four helix bundle protein
MQNEKCKVQNQRINLSDRLLDFGASIVRVSGKLNGSSGGRHIGNQLVRAATSSGANYEEACGGESRADFIHKLQIVLKELRESLYWLRLADRAGLISAQDVKPLISEADALAKIVGKSIVTAKGIKR